MSLDVEMQYRDIQERYRTLAMYKIAVAEEELTAVESIDQKWEDLFAQAKHIDRSLVKVKKKFTIVNSNVVHYPSIFVMDKVFTGGYYFA